MPWRRRLFAILPIPLALAAAPTAAPAGPAPPDRATAIEFFEKKVRPVLVTSCYSCHSADTNSKGGLRVDDRNGLIAGGSTGPAVVPGDPEESLLIKAVHYSDETLKMPPKTQLSAEQVADLTKWIADGAAWPEEALPDSVGKANARYDTLREQHWAWQPLRSPEAPAVAEASWPRDTIDRFVLAKLESRGLKPAGDASRRTLIRRITFDLTGLPPTPEETRAFLDDPSADAFEKVVDRLLATPAYGERWGRHWLDVARYGESTGSSRNLPFPHAWRYRDYVIDAFTRDKPYDEFIREQVAGDLLPADSQRERDEHLVATGFLALGVKDVNQRFKVRFVMDNVDEQIDAVSRSVLGLTVSCARCHDHKFDPIPTADYYALAGIFRSSDLCAGLRNKMGGGGLDYYDSDLLLTLGKPVAEAEDPAKAEKIAKAKAAYEAARKEFEAIRGTPKGLALAANGRPTQHPFRLKMEKLRGELAALTDPAVTGSVALGVRDAKVVADTEIRIRGEAEKLGPVVPRGFLSVLTGGETPAINPKQSGRLELAQWLTRAENPLASRVMANRVWQHLFGDGLVKSVDNFGSMGDVPSLPELLDHLATRFIRENWSVKRLVRAIVLSRSYQLDSAEIAANVEVDPANRLVWRHSPRRLDAEELRDAALAIAGKLDAARPSGSPAQEFKVIELANNGPQARALGEKARASTHRSLYLPLLRGITPTSLEVFDFAEQGMVTGRRDTTTVAPQALYLLNDPFVRRQALNLAERVLGRTDGDDAARIDLAYRLAVGRPATPKDLERAAAYLADFEASYAEVLADTLPDPVFVASVEVASTSAPSTDAGKAAGGPAKAPAKPAPPVNPDEIIQEEAAAPEEVIRPADARSAAWATFCQALLGSAEFRYIK